MPAFRPIATYRLQFHLDFTFDDAEAIIDYLHDLGVDTVYASPLFKARPGSRHGYDVLDHRTINPEMGGEAGFLRFAKTLKKSQMALLLDVVPNHMCIGEGNAWWKDVLENGRSSPYAAWFDIDWHPPKVDLADKILLPELGDQYGRELENQSIRVGYDAGGFHADYGSSRYPIAPRSWSLILEMVSTRLNGRLPEQDAAMMELQSVRTALTYLPSRNENDPEKIKERYREKEVIRQRLARLVDDTPTIQEVLTQSLTELNGKKGDPHSFDQLEILLNDQVYRLSHWKVATDEINYRRFFDINELAAIRVEEPAVFDAVHDLVFRLIQQGWVSGLRIDHVDGLLDPAQYLSDLQEKCRRIRNRNENTDSAAPFYVVIEKILTGEERLRKDWNVSGTTGYDAATLINGVFVDGANSQKFLDLYARFTGRVSALSDVVNTAKKFIMLVSMSSELHMLASHLDHISEQHRWSRDFTFESLRFALREVTACFPIYRSYVRKEQKETAPEDEAAIRTAVDGAKRRNPATSESIFDFIQDVLLLKNPEGLSEDQITDRKNFLLRFQQFTSPVMAKGVEDTAFYRFFPLASLNDVGGSPEQFGVSIDEFHRRNKERLENWPFTLLATSTHDNKRSEDVRARLNVLSEIPTPWYRAITRWQAWNERHKTTVRGALAPDANDEYLIYQTLLGTWPLEPMDKAGWRHYGERVEAYMMKAIKEAKLHTSWINPNKDYEESVSRFVRGLLESGQDNRFIDDFSAFQAPVARAGLFNSLSQLVLKLTMPGVPDFYQGTETWNFRLVDPDNREAVDFFTLRKTLKNVLKESEKNRPDFVQRALTTLIDGRLKLYTAARLLAWRNADRDLFESGDYVPLTVEGPMQKHVAAFARVRGEHAAIVVLTRFHFSLGNDALKEEEKSHWENTTVSMKSVSFALRFENHLTGATVEPQRGGVLWTFSIADLLGPLPVAVIRGAVPPVKTG